MQKNFRLVICVATLSVLLSGCASLFFPDFDEPTETVINDGGQIEEHKIEKKGILVSDLENASHEGEPDKAENPVAEKVVSEKEGQAHEVAPVEEDNVKTVNESFEGDVSAEVKPESHLQMHYLAETIYFGNGGVSIDSRYNKSLRKIAKIAKEHNAVITVYGFASSRTNDTDPVTHKLVNFKVSADRAQNVARELQRLGVKKDKIITQALSDTVPMYQEVMPEGERLNRRAEIYLTY